MLANSGMSRRRQQALLQKVTESGGVLPVQLEEPSSASRVVAKGIPKQDPSLASRPGRRPQADIRKLCDDYAMDPYRSSYTRDRSKDILHLQSRMSGESAESLVDVKKKSIRRSSGGHQDADGMSTSDVLHDLQTEMQERQSWLQDMERLGCAAPYRTQIQAEINLRRQQIRALSTKLERDQ